MKSRRQMLGMVAALGIPAPELGASSDPAAAMASEWLTLHSAAVAAWKRCHEVRDAERAVGAVRSQEGRAVWDRANDLSETLYGLTDRLEITSAETVAGAILRVEVGLKLSLFEDDPTDPSVLQEHRIVFSALDDLKRLANMT